MVNQQRKENEMQINEARPDHLIKVGTDALKNAMKEVDAQEEHLRTGGAYNPGVKAVESKTPKELADMTRAAMEDAIRKHTESIERNDEQIKILQDANEISKREIAGCKAYLTNQPKQPAKRPKRNAKTLTPAMGKTLQDKMDNKKT